MRVGVIGVGNMGSKYAQILQDREIEGMELGAITRVREPYSTILAKSIEGGIPVFESGEALLDAVAEGKLDIDTIIIATPHMAHPRYAIRAFELGLNVLTDKPAGVYSSEARLMTEAAKKSGKEYGIIFNQRTSPVYIRLREIIKSGIYGKVKRVSWTVTDWYRPDCYYQGSSWRATWGKDGGGVLLNQCPHNLDLLCWMFGVPTKVQGYCKEGKYHSIEVEDYVTAYFEWGNEFTGTFTTSTGEAIGSNRLEIAFDEAYIICENGELKIGELYPEIKCTEKEYRNTATEPFRKLKGEWHTETFEKEEQPYNKVLKGFYDKCSGSGEHIAEGETGKDSLILSNAIYLSSWLGKMIELPQNTFDEERFEKRFCAAMSEKVANSKSNS